MATLILKGSIGAGKARGKRPHNDPDDFRIVRKRFVKLGYSWVGKIKSPSDKEFIRVIKLFQSICSGSTSPQASRSSSEWKLSRWRTKEFNMLSVADGRMDPGGLTHRWLAAKNAPGWVKINGRSGLGWRCSHTLHGEHTTTWMLDAIQRTGRAYVANLLKRHASVAVPMTAAKVGLLTAPLWIRECSSEKGGKIPGHGSHQTGLDVDMRLPMLPPNQWNQFMINFDDSRYDQESAMLQLQAIKSSMNLHRSLARKPLFNDPDLIKLRLCRKDNATHRNHFHVRISPPTRVDGIADVYSLGSKIVRDAYEAMSQVASGVYGALEDAYDGIMDLWD